MLIVWMLISELWYNKLNITDDMFIVRNFRIYSPRKGKDYAINVDTGHYIIEHINHQNNIMVVGGDMFSGGITKKFAYKTRLTFNRADDFFVMSIPNEQILNELTRIKLINTPVPTPKPVPLPTPIIIPCNTHKNKYPFIIRTFILNTIFE